MGLFDFLGTKKTSATQGKVASKERTIEKIIQDSDKAIADMQKADAAFQKDGNLSKRISVYEKYLKEKPEWNSFNFCLSLSKMYVKADRNDEAWRYLNQMYLWSIDPSAVGGDASKVRLEQFKILKGEKRYKDALVMLTCCYVLNAYATRDMFFNKEKFQKDAKTTVKAIGFSDSDFLAFADELEKNIKSKRIKEATVQQFCASWYGKLGI